MLAIHVNAGGGTGSEAWVHTASSQNTRLIAAGFVDVLGKVWGMRSRGVKLDQIMPEGYHSDELYCFKRPAERPEILLELAFIDHRYDVLLLSDRGQIKALASGMARYISELELGTPQPANEPEAPTVAQLQAQVKKMEIAIAYANELKAGNEHWTRKILGLIYAARPHVAGTEWVSAGDALLDSLNHLLTKEAKPASSPDEFIQLNVIDGSQENMDRNYPKGWR